MESRWNSAKIDDPYLSAKVQFVRFDQADSTICSTWQRQMAKSKYKFDNEKLNIAWKTLNVKWKKHFEEARFSVKPHNSITNEEFVSQKTHLVFFLTTTTWPHGLRHALAKKDRGTPSFKQRCHLSNLVKYWGSLPGTTTKGKVKLYI